MSFACKNPPNYNGKKLLCSVTISIARRYPFTISKTALTAVGSPHTWPALLACLTWFIELLEYDELVVSESENDEAAFFFGYLQQAYSTFLSGDDDACAELDKQVEDNFGQKFAAVEQEIESMRESNNQLRQKLAQLQSAGSAVPALQARKADYDSDTAKFHQLIEQLRTRHSAALAKEEERQAELDAAKAARSAAQEALRATQAAVEAQELSPADVEALKAKKERLREVRATTEASKAAVQEEVFSLEGQVGSAMSALEASVAAFHDSAAAAGLLPPNDGNAHGHNFELVLQTDVLGNSLDLNESSSSLPAGSHAGSAARLLGADVPGELLPALRQIKAQLVKDTHAHRSQQLELADCLEEGREAAEDWARAKTALQARIAALESTLAEEKAANKAQMEALDDEMQDVDSMVSDARKFAASSQQLAASVSAPALQRRQRELARIQAALKHEKERVVAAVLDAAQALVAHKQFVGGRLQHVAGTWRRKLQDVQGGSSTQYQPRMASSPPAAPPTKAPATPVAPVTPQQAASASRRASLRSAKRTPAGTPALSSPPAF